MADLADLLVRGAAFGSPFLYVRPRYQVASTPSILGDEPLNIRREGAAVILRQLLRRFLDLLREPETDRNLSRRHACHVYIMMLYDVCTMIIHTEGEAFN